MKLQGIACFLLGALTVGCSANFEHKGEHENARSGGSRDDHNGAGGEQAREGEAAPAPAEERGVGFMVRLPADYASSPRRVSADPVLSKAFAMGLADEHIRIACNGEPVATFDGLKDKNMQAMIAITLTGSGAPIALPAEKIKIENLATSDDIKQPDAREYSSKGAVISTESSQWDDVEQYNPDPSKGPEIPESESDPCGASGSVAWADSTTMENDWQVEYAEAPRGDKLELDQFTYSLPGDNGAGETSESSAEGFACGIPTEEEQPSVSDEGIDQGGYAWSQTVLYPYTCADGALVTLSGLSLAEAYFVDAVLYTPEGEALYFGSTESFTADQKSVELPMTSIQSSSVVLDVKFID